MSPDQLREQIALYLGFLGYDVEIEGELILADYPQRYKLAIQLFPLGLLVKSTLYLANATQENRLDVLECINKTNKKSVINRYYIPKQKYLVMESWYHGEYHKQMYRLFLRLRDAELCGLFAKLPELQKYATES